MRSMSPERSNKIKSRFGSSKSYTEESWNQKENCGDLRGVLISSGFHNNVRQTGWLKTNNINYFLLVPGG